jgi:hypothetical protein
VLYDPDAANEGTEWTFALYYDGTTGGEEAIGLAYSADGILWHGHDADGDGRADPVLEGTRLAGDWDYDYVSRATIIRSRAWYEMWYSGGVGAMNQGIGYARSADGIHWTRDSDNPILHASDGVAWRSGRTYTPAVIRWSDGLYKMWFAGVAAETYSIGYAQGQAARFRALASQPLPAGLVLRPNRPNPFNPETQIDFALPQDMMAELVVFDALGRRVRTLLQGTLNAGTHQARWDGRDRQGRPVASGTYFYHLQAGPYQLSGRMLLLR